MTTMSATFAHGGSFASIFSAAAEAANGLRRWNQRRAAADELRRLTRAQLNDIGLEGVDFDDLARRLVR